MKGKYIILIILFYTFLLKADTNLFYNINWSFEKKKSDIYLYLSKDNEKNLYYYKALTRVKNIEFDKIVNILSDFDNYSKIFPRTISFRPISTISENKFIIHSILNFFPYKNREYIVELTINKKIINGKRIYSLFWNPVESNDFLFNNKKNHQVKNVYGMWHIEELENNEIKITFFSFNDWEIKAPQNFKIEFEKNGTINNVIDLLKQIN